MIFRKSSPPEAGASLEEVALDPLPESLIRTFELLEDDVLVIDNDDAPIFQSEGISSLNILKDSVLHGDEILAIVRAVRRTGKPHQGIVEIARGPIGEGRRKIKIAVTTLDEDTTLILINDESEKSRVDAIRRDFIANISHELKTPIGGISILAEAIAEGSDDPELVKNFSARMKIEAERLTNLVQEIIDLSRIQDQNTTLNSEYFSLNELIEEAINQSKVHAEKQQVQINFAPEGEVEFFGDRKQLLIAFSNLVDNAINYSPERTNVNVVLKQSDDVVEIAVSDQGVGIEESELARIFERFYRVDQARSRDTGGTGLGLSIVKHVISNHGGEVQVWSVPGTGSTFTVLLRLTNMKDRK